MEFMYQLATQHTFASIPDPYLRYAPQAVLLWVVSLFIQITPSFALTFYTEYTLVLSAIVSPGLAYLFARYHYNRTTGIITLVFICIAGVRDWFSIVPQIPMPLLQRIPSASSRWIAPSQPLFGIPYYFSEEFQYAFAIPFILAAFLFWSRSDHTRNQVLAGMLIGVAGSIQIIQGLIAALTIGIDAMRRSAWKEVGQTALTAIVFSLPNFVLLIRYTDRWTRMGGGRMSFAPTNIVLFMGFVFILVATIILRRRYSTALIPWNGKLSGFHTMWLLVPGLLIYLSIPFSAGWYRWLAAGIFKYAALMAIAVWVAPTVTEVRRSINSPAKIQADDITER